MDLCSARRECRDAVGPPEQLDLRPVKIVHKVRKLQLAHMSCTVRKWPMIGLGRTADILLQPVVPREK